MTALTDTTPLSASELQQLRNAIKGGAAAYVYHTLGMPVLVPLSRLIATIDDANSRTLAIADPGQLVILEAPQMVPEALAKIVNDLAKITARTGVDFAVLTGGLTVAGCEGGDVA